MVTQLREAGSKHWNVDVLVAIGVALALGIIIGAAIEHFGIHHGHMADAIRWGGKSVPLARWVWW